MELDSVQEPQKPGFHRGIGTMDLSQNGELDDDTRGHGDGRG